MTARPPHRCAYCGRACWGNACSQHGPLTALEHADLDADQWADVRAVEHAREPGALVAAMVNS
jgi:hypothetical protein